MIAWYSTTTKTENDKLKGLSSHLYKEKSDAQKAVDRQNAKVEEMGLKTRYYVGATNCADLPASLANTPVRDSY